MKRVVYGSKMKKVDSYTIEHIGIPSMVLMERAAFSVFQYIDKNVGRDKRILCLCGMGNNGADGIALARMLKLSGYGVNVYCVGNEDKATEQWTLQKRIALKCDVLVENISENIDKLKVTEDIKVAYDIIIDAIFGIGLTRNVEGIYAQVIDNINIIRQQERTKGSLLKVYALDVPSGLCADTGRVMGHAIGADITFTFGAVKTGLLLYKGKDFAGKIMENDIGFADKSYNEVLEKGEYGFCVEEEDLISVLTRKKHSNKGSYGKILLIGGSENVYGAAYMSAAASLKAGCGLLKIITHRNNRDLLYNKLPEALINVYDTDETEDVLINMVDEAAKWADVIVVGPGMSKAEEAIVLLKQAMLKSKQMEKTIIIDADGLNIISENPEYMEYYHEKTIITPHIGEAARLMKKSGNEIAENVVEAAKTYGYKHNINVVLKDSTTVILGIESSVNKCNNRVCINTTGNAGMATGGSGDVLAGIIAAVVAGGIDVKEMQMYKNAEDKCGEELFLAAAIAVYIHGLAGDMAAEKQGKTSMTATDILDMIPRVLAIDKFDR